MKQSVKQKLGLIGEEVAVKHLVKHSYQILDRNYRKKWGEIDIVARKNDILHFIEVKSMKIKGLSDTDIPISDTDIQDGNYQPEENIHWWKRQRLARAIKTYLAEKKVSCETEWQIDAIAVFLDFNTRRAKIRITENIIL